MPGFGPEGFRPAATFEQRFEVAYPPDALFALLGNMSAVAACLPGASLTALPASDRVEGEMRVRIGPISAAFRGSALMERDAATRSGRILGGGIDARGRSTARGEIRYRVVTAQGGTACIVELEVGYTLTGVLGQFGRRGLVRDLANRLTAEFVCNLELRLSGRAPPAAQRTEFHAIGFLFGLLRARLRRLFRLSA